MKYVLIILIMLPIFLFSQNKSGNNMIIGDQGMHAFFLNNNSKPIMKQTFLPFPIIPQRNLDIGSCCISDSANGRLLITCNGFTIYDTLGNIIENGDSLVPNKIYNHNGSFKASGVSQTSLLIPKGNSGLYYLFTPTVTNSMYDTIIANPFKGAWFDLLQYHIIDMNANGGAGKVIAKNIPLMQNAKLAQCGMQGCRHANGVDWWVLKNGVNDTNVIYRFLVTADTIIGPDSQFFATPKYSAKAVNYRGQAAFSANGKKYAFVSAKNSRLFVADFNRCTGLLSNPIIDSIPALTTTDPYYDTAGYKDWTSNGVAFSPNDSFIYVATDYNIHQLELYKTDTTRWYNVQHGSDTTLQKFEFYSTLHRGIDGRIYIGKGSGISRSNSVIDNPNNKGAACGFCRKCLRCDTCLYWTVAPANMPDFNLGADSSSCWPLSNVQLAISNEQVKVYPNPANSVLYMQTTSKQKRELYNYIGQLLFTTAENKIDVSKYPRGLYFVKCGAEVIKVVLE
ncbi:MAG: T9SS type A sorting domain-containing protein [Chitinophagaceae bacterium]|nr:T9SS type A sorting domain-containing protein [Chitinophagaceae bacterium]